MCQKEYIRICRGANIIAINKNCGRKTMFRQLFVSISKGRKVVKKLVGSVACESVRGETYFVRLRPSF